MRESVAPERSAGRIAVAMSGGVDSSVAALILHRQGESLVGLSLQLHDASGGGGGRAGRGLILARQGESLVGLSLQLHDASGGESSRAGRCCSPRDFLDARLVA